MNIFAKRKGIHIINLTRTAHFLSEACDLVFDIASRRKQFLIVGTKNKAVDSVARAGGAPLELIAAPELQIQFPSYRGKIIQKLTFQPLVKLVN